MRLTKKIALLTLAVALVAAACGGDDDEATNTTVAATQATTTTTEAPADPGTIVDIAVAAGSFDTLVTAVTAAGLADTLSGEGPFTVFAPTDDAFAALPEGALEGLLADTDALTEVLLYHVVSGDVRAADVVNLATATTLAGADITIDVMDGVMLNASNVIQTDIVASNGVIHVIDAVLLPPGFGEDDAMDDDMGDEAVGTIVDVAVGAGTFETLVAAVQAAGLVDTLTGDGPFTVFAPTDEAFAALPEGTVAALLEDIPALTDILLYHVVAGEVKAADVVGLDSATTVQGSDITITIDGETVMVDAANVIATDVMASNGVIHVIDAVILPPGN
ncbi:MAG: fasciclin domain-containing protein [Acidimicrobiia bacterium]|nr:fasciclin domain-containing protein [Acidimicrobiia bacterium]